MWTDSRITKLEKIWKSLPAWRFACSVEKSVWCSPLVLAHLFLESQGNILLSRAGREKMRLTKLLLVVVWSDFGLGDVNPTKVKPWEWKKKKTRKSWFYYLKWASQSAKKTWSRSITNKTWFPKASCNTSINTKFNNNEVWSETLLLSTKWFFLELSHSFNCDSY